MATLAAAVLLCSTLAVSVAAPGPAKGAPAILATVTSTVTQNFPDGEVTFNGIENEVSKSTVKLSNGARPEGVVILRQTQRPFREDPSAPVELDRARVGIDGKAVLHFPRRYDPRQNFFRTEFVPDDPEAVAGSRSDYDRLSFKEKQADVRLKLVDDTVRVNDTFDYVLRIEGTGERNIFGGFNLQLVGSDRLLGGTEYFGGYGDDGYTTAPFRRKIRCEATDGPRACDFEKPGDYKLRLNYGAWSWWVEGAYSNNVTLHVRR